MNNEISKNKNNSSAAVDLDTDVDNESASVTTIDRNICINSNKYGGWKEEDHNVFMKVSK